MTTATTSANPYSLLGLTAHVSSSRRAQLYNYQREVDAFAAAWAPVLRDVLRSRTRQIVCNACGDAASVLVHRPGDADRSVEARCMSHGLTEGEALIMLASVDMDSVNVIRSMGVAEALHSHRTGPLWLVETITGHRPSSRAARPLGVACA